MLDHLSERPLRVRHGPGLVDHRAARASASTTPSSPRRCSTRSLPADRRACGPRPTTPTTASFFSMPERNVLPKPYTSRTRRCGWPPATPARSRRRPAWASASCASPSARPRRSAPLIEIYKNEHRERRARRRLRQQQRDGHQPDAVPRGRRQAPRDRHRHDLRATTPASSSGTSTPSPSPTGIPDWPELLPEPTLEEVEAAHRRRRCCVGDPDECARDRPALRRHRRRPAHLRDAVDDDADRHRRRSGRDLRPARDPAVRHGPACTAPPASAKTRWAWQPDPPCSRSSRMVPDGRSSSRPTRLNSWITTTSRSSISSSERWELVPRHLISWVPTE